MRRTTGSLLIGLSIVLMVATVVPFVLETVRFPRDANEDQRTALVAGILFVIVLLLLEVAMLLAGRHLRRSSAVAQGGEVRQPRRPVRPLPASLYLGGSIVTGLFAAFLPEGPEALKPLWVLVGQPVIFAQILLSGILGLKLKPGLLRQDVITAFSLAYFLLLFYPLYRLLTMDRAAETAACKRMTALLTLFGSVHVLIALAVATLAKA